MFMKSGARSEQEIRECRRCHRGRGQAHEACGARCTRSGRCAPERASPRPPLRSLVLLALAVATASGQRALDAAAADSQAAAAPAAASLPPQEPQPAYERVVAEEHAGVWEHVWSVALLHRLETIQLKRAEALGKTVSLSKEDAKGGPRPPLLRLLIVGDSTMREQAKYLCDVLLEERCNMLTKEGCHTEPQRTCTNERLNVRVELYNTYACSWDFIQKPVAPPAPNEATVFYYNCGLHMLHLFPARPFEDIQLSLHAHSIVRNSFVRARHMFGKHALLVWMTINDIVEERFTGAYGQNASAWKSKQSAAALLEACMDQYRDQVQDVLQLHGLDHNEGRWEEQLHDWCRNGVFLDSGVQWLNARLQRHIPDDVSIVDGYATTRWRSWATSYSDARHYRLFRPVKLEQLLSYVATHFV